MTVLSETIISVTVFSGKVMSVLSAMVISVLSGTIISMTVIWNGNMCVVLGMRTQRT